MHCADCRHVMLLCRAGKKTYTVLMGKPAPAKLANFPEVEVWVQVRHRPPTTLRRSQQFCVALLL